MMNKNITESFKFLKDGIMMAKPLGGTALGPGLLTSVVMAGEGGPGSVVVLCTDGMANEGIGAMNGSLK